MPSMTFNINDQSTGGGVPLIQVTITENPDGTLSFKIVQLVAAGNYLGDLRGFFFDVAESLLGTLSVTSATKTLADGTTMTAPTTFSSSNDGVKSVGSSSNNMNGMLGSDGGFDFGIEIGSEGVGKNGDDVRGFEFTLDSNARDLKLADFQDVNFGMRVMSVGLDTNGDGIIDTTRNGSVKVLENGVTVTAQNAVVELDDDALAGGNIGGDGDNADAANTTGILSHDFGSASGTVRLTGIEFPSDLGLESAISDGVITVFQDGIAVLRITITDPAAGTYSVEQLSAMKHPGGEDENNIGFVVGYEARSGDGDVASGTLSISVDDDTPLIGGSSVTTGALAENSAVRPASQNAVSGQIAFSGADAATAAVSTSASEVSVSFTSGDGVSADLPASLDLACLRDAFSITSTGHWTYDASSLVLEMLAEGDVVELTYRIVVTDSDGDETTQKVTITINGTNDAPVIGMADLHGAVTERADLTDDENEAMLSASGTIAFADVDLSDDHAITVTPAASSYLGTLTAIVSNPSTGDGAGVVSWRFEVSDGAADYLGAGDTLTQDFTIKVDDGNGGTASQLVTVTITGTNDVPVIGGVATGAVSEDASPSLTTGGALTIADVDQGQSSFAPQSSRAGTYGTFTLAADGRWTYTADNSQAAIQQLGATQSLTDSFTAVSSDGTASQLVTVTITGTNDVPVITSSAQSGAVTEDTALTATGRVTSSDVDHGATAAYSGNATGTYGSFAVDAASGVWTYTLANAAHQTLAEGENHEEIFTVTVTDEHGGVATQDVTVTVTGTNDVPVAVASSNAVDEDASISGTVSASDADHDQTATLSYALVGAAPPGFTLHADGDYSFDASYYDWLVEGETRDLEIFFTASDATSTSEHSKLTITITGKNDGAVIDTGSIRDVFEDEVDRATASGTLSIVDPDAGEAAFVAVTMQGTYGSLVLSGSGSWTYTLDNDDPDLNLLDSDAFALERFSITSIDGTKATLQVRVNGKDEAPVEVRVNDKADDMDFDNPAAITIFNGVAARSNNFTGGGGDDILLGDGGDQRINGNAGNDTIHGAGGDDEINGNGHDDTLFGGEGNDVINGQGGADILYGGSGNDTLFGEAASEKIYGGSGDDRITGGGAGDNLWGGTGADTFIFVQPDSTVGQRDTIFDFSHAEGDKIDLRAILGFEAEGWLGELPNATAMLPRGLGYVDNHDGSLTIYGDHNGDGVSDLAITVFGVGSLQSSDFMFA